MAEASPPIGDRTAHVAVLGHGYGGLVLAMQASQAGSQVILLKINEDTAA